MINYQHKFVDGLLDGVYAGLVEKVNGKEIKKGSKYDWVNRDPLFGSFFNTRIKLEEGFVWVKYNKRSFFKKDKEIWIIAKGIDDIIVDICAFKLDDYIKGKAIKNENFENSLVYGIENEGFVVNGNDSIEEFKKENIKDIVNEVKNNINCNSYNKYRSEVYMIR